MPFDRGRAIKELREGMEAQRALARALGLDYACLLRGDVLHVLYTEPDALIRLLDALENEYRPASGETLN